MNKWPIKYNQACDCGAELQTINHIVSKSEKEVQRYPSELHVTLDEAIRWLNNLNIDTV